MNKKLLSLALAIVTIASTGAYAEKPSPDEFGPDMMGEGPGHNPKHFEKMIAELKLTKEQQVKARALHEKGQPAMKAQMEKIRPLHEQLRGLLEAEKVDLTAVRQKLTEISAIQIETRMQHIQHRLEFESILTPEQKTKMRQIHKDRMEKGRKEHGRDGHDKRQKPDRDK
ncbi:MAG: Spy/CpxP family protein refolding chaperone [Spirochaetia bacterium]|nr:Spy/CpxP family protein refolding chaperone [Spirochaetia bacterium]